MNADGASEREIWHEQADDARRNTLRRRHERIAEIILLAKDGPTGGRALGTTDGKAWHIKYRALRVQSDKEQAEIAKLHADTDQLNIDKGIYSAPDVALSRFTALGSGAIQLDPAAVSARVKRQRELDDQPPKDNAQLGTVGARLTARADLIGKLNTGALTRGQVKAALMDEVKLTAEQAEAAMDTPEAIARLEPPEPKTPPGPAPRAPNGSGAGAPPTIPGLNAGGDPKKDTLPGNG